MTRLTAEESTVVLDAIGALELAEGVVPAAAFVALSDPGLRRVVDERLQACGRTLIALPSDGFASGYRDDIADALLQEGFTCLSPTERAVLALVLLRTVAIPRARGTISGQDWVHESGSTPTTIDDLALNRRLTRKSLDAGVRRLRTLGLLRPGHRAGIAPGPALLRLTPARSSWLWEDLLLLAAPDSAYARVIRQRRASPTATSPSSADEPRTSQTAPGGPDPQEKP